MIDRFSPQWKEVCELIDYTYSENLESWACPNDSRIDIHSPVLDRLSPGDVVYMNAINYSYFFFLLHVSSCDTGQYSFCDAFL